MTILPHKYCPFTLHPPVFSLTAAVSSLHSDHSPAVHITHFTKNNNNNNTPAYSSSLGWAPHLHIFIFASLPSVYRTTICTTKCTIECHQTFNSFPSASHGKNSPPLFLRSQNPVSTQTTSSKAHQFIGTSTKKVINIVLHPPANRGILETIWIRSLKLPPSLIDDQDVPLGLLKLSLRTCLSLIRWLNAPDLQPNHKVLPPLEVATGPPPVPDGNSFVTLMLVRGNQPSPNHTATRGTTSVESPALRPVLNSSVTTAPTQGSSSLVVQTVTSGLPTVQLLARRAFQPAWSPHCHPTTTQAPSPTLTAITKPSVTAVTGGNTSDNGLTAAVKRILQFRPQPEVTTGQPPVPPAVGNSVAPAPSSLLLQPAPTPKWPPPNLIFLAVIKDTLAWHPPPRSKPVFNFKLTELAARTNLEILERITTTCRQSSSRTPTCRFFQAASFSSPPSLIPYYRATLCGRKPSRH